MSDLISNKIKDTQDLLIWFPRPSRKNIEILSITKNLHVNSKLKDSVLELQQQLRSTEDRAAKWLELTEAAFNFATYARHHFANGDTRTKREILSSFGSNPTLKDGKLSIEAVEWLQKIRTGYEPLKAQYLRLEPGNKLMNKAQKDALASLRVQWWNTVKDVRTAIERQGVIYVSILI